MTDAELSQPLTDKEKRQLETEVCEVLTDDGVRLVMRALHQLGFGSHGGTSTSDLSPAVLEELERQDAEGPAEAGDWILPTETVRKLLGSARRLHSLKSGCGLTEEQRLAVPNLVKEVRDIAAALSQSHDEDDEALAGAWSSLALRAEQAYAAALDALDAKTLRLERVERERDDIRLIVRGLRSEACDWIGPGEDAEPHGLFILEDDPMNWHDESERIQCEFDDGIPVLTDELRTKLKAKLAQESKR